jgi:hypothetical protein
MILRDPILASMINDDNPERFMQSFYDSVFNRVKQSYAVGFDSGRLLGRGSRPVMQMSLFNKEIAVFDSATIAARKTGLTQSRICKAAKDRNRTAGGYKWRFLDD